MSPGYSNELAQTATTDQGQRTKNRLPLSEFNISGDAAKQQRLVIEGYQTAAYRLSRALCDLHAELCRGAYASIHPGEQGDASGQDQPPVVKVARHFGRDSLKHLADGAHDLLDDPIDCAMNLV
jgi:hypothetical protein